MRNIKNVWMDEVIYSAFSEPHKDANTSTQCDLTQMSSLEQRKEHLLEITKV